MLVVLLEIQHYSLIDMEIEITYAGHVVPDLRKLFLTANIMTKVVGSIMMITFIISPVRLW